MCTRIICIIIHANYNILMHEVHLIVLINKRLFNSFEEH